MADARLIGISQRELGGLAPREWQAAQAANIRLLRLQSLPIARGFAAYFEGHRVDKNGKPKAGKPITAEMFLLPNPDEPQRQTWQEQLDNIRSYMGELRRMKTMIQSQKGKSRRGN